MSFTLSWPGVLPHRRRDDRLRATGHRDRQPVQRERLLGLVHGRVVGAGALEACTVQLDEAEAHVGLACADDEGAQHRACIGVASGVNGPHLEAVRPALQRRSGEAAGVAGGPGDEVDALLLPRIQATLEAAPRLGGVVGESAGRGSGLGALRRTVADRRVGRGGVDRERPLGRRRIGATGGRQRAHLQRERTIGRVRQHERRRNSRRSSAAASRRRRCGTGTWRRSRASRMRSSASGRS